MDGSPWGVTSDVVEKAAAGVKILIKKPLNLQNSYEFHDSMFLYIGINLYILVNGRS